MSDAGNKETTIVISYLWGPYGQVGYAIQCDNLKLIDVHPRHIEA